jgi:hypothetical protein
MQKTSINIDDSTLSMTSDISTVANDWDGFCPSTDTKDTKATIEQVERSFARCRYTPEGRPASDP